MTPRSGLVRNAGQGARTDNGIGHCPAMSLAEARKAAFERWKIARTGGDARQADGTVAAPTFAEAAEAVIAMHEPTWRSPKFGPEWQASLETYPALANRLSHARFSAPVASRAALCLFICRDDRTITALTALTP